MKSVTPHSSVGEGRSPHFTLMLFA